MTVASQREAADRPDELDLWIAEVGEDYVAGLVEATRQGVAEGTIVDETQRYVAVVRVRRTMLV